ncbi:MAG: serine hydrolase [bacterium]
MDKKNKKLEHEIKRLCGSFEGRVGVAVRGLAGAEEFLLNEEESFPAASVIKIPLVMEVFRRAEEGAFSLDDRRRLREEDRVGGAGALQEMHGGLEVSVRDLVRLAFVISDNTASNMLIDLVGMEEVTRFMENIGMAKSFLGRKFMIDPLSPANVNYTTPSDMTACLAELYLGKVLSPDSSREILDIMRRQQFQEKIPLLLPSGVEVANKTGEIQGVRHDCGIILIPERPVALSVLTKDCADGARADRLIAEIALATFRYFSGG